MDLFLAVVISVLIICYWIICRENALTKQEEAVQLFEEYSNNDKHSDASIETLYRTYRFARHWLFLPILILGLPFYIAWSLFTTGKFLPKSFEKVAGPEFQKVFNTIMDMYVSKNPITSFISISLMLIMISIGSAIAFVLRKAHVELDFPTVLTGLVTRITKRHFHHACK